MSISIKSRIYLSFTLLVLLFIVNGVITTATLYNNKKLSNHISLVVDPSLQSMNDFRKVIIESKMYSTNWVFLRYNQDDKNALIKLQNKDYKALKLSLNSFASNWNDKTWQDSLKKVYINFEALLLTEKKVTGTLEKFEDYDDPVLKFEAERVVEDEIIPQAAIVMHSLEKIIEYQQNIQVKERRKLEVSSANLRALIVFLTITFICLGIFLSFYFSKIIITPIQEIKYIVNDLGKGITRFIHHHTNKDEIGEMVLSVNNLSQRLQRTASFASEVGTRNFDISFEPLSDEDTLGIALISMRDNLKQSDIQLNEAQHIAHLGNWERDTKTDKISWSDEMFSIFEIDKASLGSYGQSFLNAVHPADIEQVKLIEAENKNHRTPFSYECKIVTPTGVIKTVYIEAKGDFNEQGECNKTFGIVQDITERKKVSLALEEAHAELERLLENIDQSFFSVDAIEQKVTQMSIACEKIYGYPPEAFFKEFDLWQKLAYTEDHPVIEKGYASLFAGLPAVCEYRITHRNKSLRWIEVKMVPTLDEAGKLIKIDGVVNDIGQRKTAELERDRITADLILRNKDLEQFTYIVSHNLRAPVANIIGFVDALNDNAYPETLHKEFLSQLSVSVSKLDQVIRDINGVLEVRQKVNDVKELLSVSTIVENIQISIRNLIQQYNVTITTDFSEVDHIRSIKSFLYSILYNLISNSIKYRSPNQAPAISIKSHKTSDWIQLIFSDNGLGIDLKKNGESLFGLYKRFHLNIEGKGLGLFMTKSQIETLGGTIEVSSEINHGTTFKIYLPV